MRRHRDAHAGVRVGVTYHLGPQALGLEDHAVIDVDGQDISDDG